MATYYDYDVITSVRNSARLNRRRQWSIVDTVDLRVTGYQLVEPIRVSASNSAGRSVELEVTSRIKDNTQITSISYNIVSISSFNFSYQYSLFSEFCLIWRRRR